MAVSLIRLRAPFYDLEYPSEDPFVMVVRCGRMPSGFGLRCRWVDEHLERLQGGKRLLRDAPARHVRGAGDQRPG